MVVKRPPPIQDEPPASSPEVTPRDLYPISDIRFVLLELGKFGTKIDRLIEDVSKQSEKIGALEKKVERFTTGAAVAVVILTIVGAIAWWALGDILTKAVQSGLRSAISAPSNQTIPTPPVVISPRS